MFHAHCSSWIELSSSAFEQNISSYRSILASKTLFGCVLKGNAYGHGLEECLQIVHNHVDILFFINPIDALNVRRQESLHRWPSKRIVVIGAMSAKEAIMCALEDIELAVTHENWENILSEALQDEVFEKSDKKLKLHIHVDSGLGREGFTLENLSQKVIFLKDKKKLFIQGIMTHFANTEDVTEQTYGEFQINNLATANDIIVSTLGLTYMPERHAAQSAASLIMPDCSFEIARIGISLYGLWPSRETKISTKIVRGQTTQLTPVLAWRCKSQCIKQIHEGSYIGYGCTFRAPKHMTIAVLPVGYFDGYPRLFSHKAFVLVQGKRCSVLGRVMMNHIVVDISDIKNPGQEITATLIGSDGQESISVETCASWAETINYEIVCRLGSHIKRVIVP